MMADIRSLSVAPFTQIWISVDQPRLQFLSIAIGRPGFDLNRHRELWEFALHADWDGDSAVAVTGDVVRLAQRLIDENTLMEPSETVPGIDGSLSFVWEASGSYCYLEVGPAKTVHLYYDNAVGKWEGVFWDGDADLREHLRKAFRSLQAPALGITFKALPSSQMLVFSERVAPRNASIVDAATANSNMTPAAKLFAAA
jgi:hypothetical protein